MGQFVGDGRTAILLHADAPALVPLRRSGTPPAQRRNRQALVGDFQSQLRERCDRTGMFVPFTQDDGGRLVQHRMVDERDVD